jgi:cytochrome c553
MVREQGPFKLDNPWPRIGWLMAAGVIVTGGILGFVVLGSQHQNQPGIDTWTAICRSLGIAADTAPAGEPQPPVRTPTRIAWTSTTLADIARGNAEHGSSIALNCTACHGEQGVSQSGLFPTLAGMEAPYVYKQLDDFRSDKRSPSVMNMIAHALTIQGSADVAAFFAGRSNGLVPVTGEEFQAGHSLHEQNLAIRLVFAGDPARGIPPCAACHGPSNQKLGAPSLRRQQPAYMERQLVSFAQGIRQNDINLQMRNIATQLTPDEIHEIAAYYGRGLKGAQPSEQSTQ